MPTDENCMSEETTTLVHNSETESNIVQTTSPPAIPSISECSTPTNVLSQASPSTNGDGPMHYDPTLPPGWSRKVTQRTMGASAGKYDVYIISPSNKKIRSKTDLLQYLARNNLDLNADDFDFSVRGRHQIQAKKAFSRVQKLSNKTGRKLADAKENISNGIAAKAHYNNSENHLEGPGPASSNNTCRPKLIVKFAFPVKRLKRSASMKSKKKMKIMREKSHSAQQPSPNSDTQFAEPAASETETFNNILDDKNPPHANNNSSVDNVYTTCDNLSESDIFI